MAKAWHRNGGQRAIAAAVLGAALACALHAPAPAPPIQLAELIQAAEHARGLDFAAPVEARWLRPDEVPPTFAAELDVILTAEEARRSAAILETLGLIPPGTDLRAAILAFQSEIVAGFYTPLSDRLYVVQRGEGGDLLSGADAVVAVHELVHALQAAHSSLLTVLLGLREDDDLAFALGALLEGDALWASFRYQAGTAGLAPLSPASVAGDLSPDWAESAHPQTPRWLRDSFLLQYPTGYSLAVGLVEAGGVAALDAALVDPPLSSEELLHPELYLDPRRRRPLRVFELEQLEAPPGCRSLASNRFGELGVRVWARERGATAAQAAALAEGWDGDGARVFDCAGGRAFGWLIQFDDSVAAARFAAAAPGLTRDLATGLVGAVGVDRRGARVLLSAGLAPGTPSFWLELSSRNYSDLEAFLAAHPEVLARAQALRREVAGR